MPTTLAIRFPLGRYHANPWDRAVNEGASEWPPSPWRVLRALVATWYTRWPDLPSDVLDDLLRSLAATHPRYRTPSTITGHSRHYLPDLTHRSAEHGNTDLTLDPFLSLSRDADLLVCWVRDLSGGQRETLAKLAELIPYLGRSESVCEARLLGADEEQEPDENWWQPAVVASDDDALRTRLLAPSAPFSRETLEATTSGVRKAKRTLPPGTEWITYERAAPARRSHSTVKRVQEIKPPTAIRFAVAGRAPLRAVNGILLADEAHRVAGKLLEKADIPDDRRREIMGTAGAATAHAHAHWIPISDPNEAPGTVRYLIVYVRSGLEPQEISALIGMGALSGKRGSNGYETRGFPRQSLLFQAAGQIANVAPELCAAEPGATRWRSVTPYLPVRHRHPGRETEAEFLAGDVAAELRYRNLPAAVSVTPAEPTAARAQEFRRYRAGERLRSSRRGTGLVIEFSQALRGPLSLGQLSHFGLGLFRPKNLRLVYDGQAGRTRMEPARDEREHEHPRNAGRAIGRAAMEPAQNEREHQVRAGVVQRDRHAAMEPARDEREHFGDHGGAG